MSRAEFVLLVGSLVSAGDVVAVARLLRAAEDLARNRTE